MKIVAANNDYYQTFVNIMLSGTPSVVSRCRLFLEWLDNTGGNWLMPNLSEYRDHLLGRMTPISAQSHLSTIRGKYRKIIKRPDFDDYILYMAGGDTTERLVKKEAIINRIKLLIDADNSKIDAVMSQDYDESKFYWLTPNEADMLLASPKTETIIGFRDYIIIATFLCTGVRVMELTQLTFDDCNAKFQNHPAIRVRKGKGNKMRIVPLGVFDWILDDIAKWHTINWAEHLIVGVKNGKPTGKPITERAVQKILNKYPIKRNGEIIHLKPHDLRRTYANTLYNMGMDITAIRENMGHKTIETTKRYIGNTGIARIPQKSP